MILGLTLTGTWQEVGKADRKMTLLTFSRVQQSRSLSSFESELIALTSCTDTQALREHIHLTPRRTFGVFLDKLSVVSRRMQGSRR